MSDQNTTTADTQPEDFPTHQPPGLWVLFITEMWERFSYYGMRALLTLYLVASVAQTNADGTANKNPGFGWAAEDAFLLYGFYTWAVYLTPIFGGWLADKFLGTHRSMLVGGWIIAAGHFTLALTEAFGVTAGEVVTFQTGPGALACFLTGLWLIIIGTGFFKPCVSVMVGQLYHQNDPRRDSGFTIFYMGINLGAFFSPLVAGTLGETVGWHWGFGSAGVGMIAGLFFYQAFRHRYLRDIGLPKEGAKFLVPTAIALLVAIGITAGVAVAYRYGGFEWLGTQWAWATATTIKATVTYTLLVAAALAVILGFIFKQNPHERAPLGVIFILAFLGNLPFWSAFEQAGTSLTTFAKYDTHRPLPMPGMFRKFCEEPGFIAWWIPVVVGAALLFAAVTVFKSARTKGARFLGGTLLALTAAAEGLGWWKLLAQGSLAEFGRATEFPASWYQSVNPLAILLFAPVFAWLWMFLGRRKLDPPTPMKFMLGQWLLGIAFIAMVVGAMQARGDTLAGPHWLLITYVVYTWGELCLSPVGLSMVTKLAPARLQSLMMGFWFFSFSLANLLAGLIARVSVKIESGDMKFIIDGLPGFFLFLVVVPIGTGVVLLVLTPLLRKMMRGIH